MPTIEIFDQDNGILSFDLSQILDALQPFAVSLKWCLIEFDPWILLGEDGTRNEPPPAWVSSLVARIHTDQNGIEMDWETLKSLARYVGQTENAVLIAVEPSKAPPENPIDLNSPGYAIVVQAVDTSFWAITSRNENLIKHLKNIFKNTKIAAETSRYF
jgi:hypothetical protein